MSVLGTTLVILAKTIHAGAERYSAPPRIPKRNRDPGRRGVPLYPGVHHSPSICTILDFYNQGEHLTIEGLPEIQFGRLGGVWLGVGSSGLLGGAGYANVTFDRTQHVLFGYIEGGADFIRLNADRTYAVLFAGVQSEAGTFSIPGVPEPLPEPSAIVLLMSALVIAIPALRRRYK